MLYEGNELSYKKGWALFSAGHNVIIYKFCYEGKQGRTP